MDCHVSHYERRLGRRPGKTRSGTIETRSDTLDETFGNFGRRHGPGDSACRRGDLHLWVLRERAPAQISACLAGRSTLRQPCPQPDPPRRARHGCILGRSSRHCAPHLLHAAPLLLLPCGFFWIGGPGLVVLRLCSLAAALAVMILSYGGALRPGLRRRLPPIPGCCP